MTETQQNEASADDSWISRLGDCTGHHPESMIAVAEGLVIEMPDVSGRLRKAIDAAAQKDVERYAHTLKSCLKYVTGGPEIALAQQIELCGKEDRIEDAAKKLEELQPLVDAWQLRVQRWIDEQD